MRLQFEHISIVQGVRQAGTPGLGVTEPSSFLLPWGRPKLALYSLAVLDGPAEDQTTPVVTEALHAEFARGQQRSVTSALLTAMRAAEDALHRENARSLPQHRCSGSLCAVALRGEMAYIAFAGGGIAYSWQDGSVRRLGGPDIDIGGLDAFDECEVGLASCRVRPGDAIFLASSGLLSIATDELLATVIAKSGRMDLASRLEGLHLASPSQQDFAALVLTCAQTEMEPRAAVHATKPPMQAQAAPTERSAPRPARASAAAVQPVERSGPTASARGRGEAAGRKPPSRLETFFSRFRPASKVPQTALARQHLESGKTVTVAPPDHSASAAVAPPQPGQRPRTSISAGAVARGLQVSLVNIMLRLSMIAIVIAIIFGGVYFWEGAWRERDEQARADDLVLALEQKERDIRAATDSANKRYLLTEANRYAEQALGPGVANEKAAAIAERLRAGLDELNAVVRLPSLHLLADFAGLDRASMPSRLLAVGDDIYVLDSGAGTVWQLTLGQDLGIVAPPRALWKRGDSLDGASLGDATAAFWMYGGAPGLPEQVYALDSSGLLVRLGKDKASQAMRLPAAAALPLVRGAVGQAGNLYVLDPQRRLVWRYVPGGNGYDRPPQEYLSEVAAPDLGNAVDMASDGNLYLLFADGHISRFTGGTGQAFPAIVPDAPLRKPVSIFASPATRHLYVADTGNARVVRFTKEGEYVNQYKAPGEEFDDLRAACVDEQKMRMYMIIGTRVFVSELPVAAQP